MKHIPDGKLLLMEWDTYSRHGDGWSLWIERNSTGRWELWYKSQRYGNRFLEAAETWQVCATLVTQDLFANAGIEPSAQLFSQAAEAWMPSGHLHAAQSLVLAKGD